jgi:hypothetical protein
MKTLIALSVLAFSSTAANADWENVYQNPDLSVNHEGYVEQVRLPADDPIASAFPGNGDLHSGDGIEGGIGASSTAQTSLDRFVSGNPDFEV